MKFRFKQISTLVKACKLLNQSILLTRKVNILTNNSTQNRTINHSLTLNITREMRQELSYHRIKLITLQVSVKLRIICNKSSVKTINPILKNTSTTLT